MNSFWSYKKRDLRRSLGLSWPYLILIFNWPGRILKMPMEFKAIWKTNPTHIIYFSFQKSCHTTRWRPPNWQPTGVDIFLGFTTFQWNWEKKRRMDSSWNRLDQSSFKTIENMFKTSITPTKVISCLELPRFVRSASCENIVASVPDPDSFIRPGKHGDLK